MTVAGRRAASGFTLVEVVVALTLIAVLLAGLVAALGTFGNTGSRLERRALASDDMRLVHAFLRQSLGAASARTHVRETDQVSTVWFGGMSDRVEWIGLMPARHGVGGLYHLRVSVVGEAGAAELVLAYRPYAGDDPDEASPPETSHRLLAGDLALELAYLALGETQWRSEWDDPQVLPGHVRIQVVQDGVQWPTLVVRVLAAERPADIGEDALRDGSVRP